MSGSSVVHGVHGRAFLSLVTFRFHPLTIRSDVDGTPCLSPRLRHRLGRLAFTGSLWQNAFAAPAQNAPGPYGPLQAADANGIQLPAGFTSQVVARSAQTVPGTSYTWHSAPDGGACFADGSGWIYVSNSEMSSGSGGGVSMLRFNSGGTVTAASRILSGTNQNCMTGPFRT